VPAPGDPRTASGTGDRPIFIVGCPRSGTTLLSVMLHAHSRIAFTPETRFVMPVFRGRAAFGDLSVRANRRKAFRAIVRRGTKFRDLGLDRRQVRRRLLRAPGTVGSVLGEVFRAYAARFDAKRWGDKRPIYFQSIPTIRAMFPTAQFIHLIRDGRDSVASLSRMRWWQQDTADAVALWNQAIDTGRRARRSLPPDVYYELRYERLVADPETELRALCDFLGEEFEPGMVEPHRVAAEAVPERKTWHDNVRTAVSTQRVGGYTDVLTPDELRLLEFVSARNLRRLGYAAPRRPRPPRPLALLRYLRTSVRLRLGTRRAQRRDLASLRRDPFVADLGPGGDRLRTPTRRNGTPPW
jgi:hypothetical protein